MCTKIRTDVDSFAVQNHGFLQAPEGRDNAVNRHIPSGAFGLPLMHPDAISEAERVAFPWIDTAFSTPADRASTDLFCFNHKSYGMTGSGHNPFD